MSDILMFILWILIVMALLLLLVLPGCQSSSRIEIPIPGDGVRVITGQAADDYVAGLVDSEKTVSDRLGGMFKVFPTLIFTLIGGFIFWGFTRSRFGWVIPAAVAGGMLFIVAFAKWAEWIAGGVILVSLAVLVWKVIEYKRERDNNIKG